MSQPFVIRPLGGAADLPSLYKCLRVLSPCPWPGASEASNVTAYRRGASIRTLVAVSEDGEVVGTASYFWERKFTRNGAYVGHIEDVAVLPQWQGWGVGKALVAEAIQGLKSRNCYKVVLSCSEANAAFYSKFGFRSTEVTMRLDLSASTQGAEHAAN